MNEVAENTKQSNRIRDITVARSDMYSVDPRTVMVRSGWNKRDFNDPENQAHVEMLAESIATVGVLNPIVVRFQDGRIILADGECRLRATLLAIDRGANILAIPAVTEKKGVDDAGQIAAQGTRNMGKQMTDLEFAKICAELVGFEWDVERIAKTMGKTTAWVEGKLMLAEAPTAVKKLVRDGTVAAGTVVKAIAKDGLTAASEAIQEAAKAPAAAPAASNGKVSAAKPAPKVRVTAKALEARGGAPPTKNVTRDQARGAIKTLQDIVAIQDGNDEAKQMAINWLEGMDLLLPL